MDHSLDYDVRITLERLLPRLKPKASSDKEWAAFEANLNTQFPRLFALLRSLYGDQYDFYYHLENTLETLLIAYQERPSVLRNQDKKRQADPLWFKRETMLGAACYVDLFAGDLKALREQIPYLKELGLTYLHLMPLFKAPEANSDGGYAVSDYRQVNPALGTMNDLKRLAAALRKEGIVMVLDFVFNHTSDEHDWAVRAQHGEQEYLDYYFCFDHRSQMAPYEPYLREIFPEIRQGCFTWRDDMQRWIWTTFNSFQWDLNYRNPAVFNAMLGELLFLANAGADVLRFDALAFVWKEAGTTCENLPQAHSLIQAFNAAARIAAPGLLFKSEAIVHPDDVVRYINTDECQLSYNPLTMAMLWNTLATRDVTLMTRSLQARFPIPPDTAWVNYIRGHDDIGWTFDDTIAWSLGTDPDHHRRFLNQFYTGQFPGSFARGVPFQENKTTGDCRVAGQLASLAGLEQALNDQDAEEVRRSINRIMLMHALILSIGGVPLLYLGDELGLLNDYSYQQDVNKLNDSRWVNRVAVKDADLELRHQPDTPNGQVYAGLQRLVAIRKATPLLGEAHTHIIETGNPHVFGFTRTRDAETLLVLANFADFEQSLDQSLIDSLLTGGNPTDLLEIKPSSDLKTLQPHQVRWLIVQQ
ncbi:alpha-amylase family glycosyl hydrolase [Saccharospirillum alexandrii]|uniref:alpha-amylase family glycosyl hydrolase n=1 Tax=Saccharospirillum alexandrii TaxID=2448477 RepID=UPI000FDA35C5|nr:alpha-amylase family glycosyl hydrolase [Saccharospirillum alexandrii]